jgi:ubiquinone biosynthesis protein
MARREVLRLLELAYPDGAPFVQFEPTPLAVGSIGQVHRARLPDGRGVVVKLLRPGIEQALQQDMRAARAFVDLFFRLAGDGAQDRRHGALRVLDDLTRAFSREADLELEAATLEEFGRRLAGSARVRVPHCYREWSSRIALVQEELQGVPLSTLREGSDGQRDEARRAAHLALTEILSQVFSDGHFHADPHAGNLLLLADGRLGLIDLGLTARLGPAERRTIARAVRALLARDIDATFRLLLELGTAPPDFDLAAYRSEIARVLRRRGRRAISRVSGANAGREAAGQADANGLERMVDELFAVTRRHGILLPESTTLLIKTLVTIEGVARSLDPEINVLVKAVPIVLRSLAPGWPSLPSWLRRGRG